MSRQKFPQRITGVAVVILAGLGLGFWAACYWKVDASIHVQEPAKLVVADLARSGLVLAGANRASSDTQASAFLTALEISSQDLPNLDLAVLSACETGLGRAETSSGVLGLQWVFQIAGARTTVSSTWIDSLA